MGIESLIGNSHFAGRDGFQWFCGQVPSNASQSEQVSEGEGVGNRCKVRIAGRHPFNVGDLSDEELPWANLLLPVTAGAGGANYAHSSVIQQGDIVFGFYLDGDKQQVPLVIGTFPRTQLVNTKGQPTAFVPGTGYSDVTPKPINGFLSESNEQHNTSQPTPGTTGTKPDQAGTGESVQPADTCKKNPISRMTTEIEKFLNRVQKFALAGQNLENEIRATADILKTSANQFVGTLIEKLFDKIEKEGQKGLDKLYKAAYAAVFASTGSPVAAHKAGVAVQASMLLPTFTVQEAIGCVANAVVEGLFGIIEGLLRDLVNTGKNFAGCLGAQFVGAFMNKIIDQLVDAISGPLQGISKILDPVLNITNFLLSAADNINSIASFLDCNQSNDGKCPQDKEYTVGGNSKEKGEDPFEYVMNAMNFSRGAANLANDFEKEYGSWDIFGDGSLLSGSSSVIPGGCYAGPPENCTGPYVEIFGGGGAGAAAKVIMGYFLDAADSGSGTTLGDIVGGVSRTGSIIGVEMTDLGSGYRYPPMVNFRDKCGLGYGANAKAILGGENGDQVVAIVMTTTGEGYPVVENENAENSGVTQVVVVNPGSGYQQTDRVVIPGVSPSGDVFTPAPEGVTLVGAGIGTSPIFDIRVDDNGGITEVKVLNILRFDETLPELRVESDTGFGAILKPVFGILPTDRQVGIVSSIDCV
jgi:hypothetical protein